MAEHGLWDNVTLPPTLDAGGSGFWWEIGVRFTVTAETTGVGVKWYRPDTIGPNMVGMNLWRVSDQELLRHIDSPLDNGTVGWQRTDFDVPVALETGVDYVVTVEQPNLYRMGYKTGAGFPPTPGSGLAFDSPYHMSSAQGAHGFPGASNNTTFAYLIDIVIDADVEAPTGEVAVDIENALARWFDVEDAPNLRPGSLAVVIYDYLQTMQGVIDTVNGKVQEVEGVVEGILGPSGALFTGLLRGYLDNLSGLVTQTLDAVDALQGPGGHTVAEVLTAVEAIPTTGGGVTLPLFDGSGAWTQTDQTVGQGASVWLQPADAYVIHVEDMAESARSERAVGTAEIYWLRGWAKPWDGTHWGPEHILVNGLTQVVQGVRPWDGIGFWLPPDVEWTITAYDYTP